MFGKAVQDALGGNITCMLHQGMQILVKLSGWGGGDVGGVGEGGVWTNILDPNDPLKGPGLGGSCAAPTTGSGGLGLSSVGCGCSSSGSGCPVTCVHIVCMCVCVCDRVCVSACVLTTRNESPPSAYVCARKRHTRFGLCDVLSCDMTTHTAVWHAVPAHPTHHAQPVVRVFLLCAAPLPPSPYTYRPPPYGIGST